MKQEEVKTIIIDILVTELELDLDDILNNLAQNHQRKNVRVEDLSLHDDIRIESLTYVDLISQIEKKFGLKVNLQDLDNVHTIQDLEDFILSKTI